MQLPPHQAKSPPIPKPPVPAELNSPTVTGNQHVLPITEIDIPKKIQRIPFATYPDPPPLIPEDYFKLLWDWKEEMDKEDVQPKCTPERQRDAVFIALKALKTRNILARGL